MRTDIAGFVGFAERGPLPEDFQSGPFDPLQVALKITSWKEFETNFGGFRRYGYLAYAVRAFFENGGDTCYVVRVAATTAPALADQAATAFFALPAGPSLPVGKLGQIVSGFQSEFLPSGDVLLSEGDLVRIGDNRVTQLNHVAAVLGGGGQILWSRKLDPSIASGAPVSRFPSACTIRAASRGNWGNAIRVQITPLDGGMFGLRATVDPGPDSLPMEDEFYRRLTLANPAVNNQPPTTADQIRNNYAPAILQQESNLVRIDGVNSALINLQADEQLASGWFYLQGGRDGLSKVTLRDFTGAMTDLRGLRLLEEVDDVGILAVPDSVFQGADALSLTPPPPDLCQPLPVPVPDPVLDDPTAEATPLDPADSRQLQMLMIDQCERLHYRVALIDPPDRKQIGEMQDWPKNQGLVMRSSRFAAIYYPWLKVPDALGIEGLSRRIPPSGHVAGAYAQTDLTYGVQRPPANVELQFVDDVTQAISDLQQEGLNDNSVNAIRTFPGRGVRVWGARSLAPRDDSEWRFIHVRRLMSAIEETAQRSSRWAVFQNNNHALRNSLKHSLTVLLEGIWAKGGLKGTKPVDAFYVKCDTTNNPQSVIDQGKVICEVGVAVAAPMEFIIFEIHQDASGAQVLEN